jgi:hypothetical protein
MKRWVGFGGIADNLLNIGRARPFSRRLTPLDLPAQENPLCYALPLAAVAASLPCLPDGAEANFAKSFLRRKVAMRP